MTDLSVDMELGPGEVKITPAHDYNDHVTRLWSPVIVSGRQTVVCGVPPLLHL